MQKETERVEPVWGAVDIGDVIGTSPRKTFYLLEKGILPARKVGAIWQSTRGELRDFLLGVTPGATREVGRRVVEASTAE